MDAANLTKCACLGVALVPLTIRNLRSGVISNADVLWLFVLGLVWNGLSRWAGWPQISLAYQVGWFFAGFVGWFIVFKFTGLGGVCKALIALTLWFAGGSYAAVLAISMLLVWSIAKVTGRGEALYGPPLLVAALAVAAA